MIKSAVDVFAEWAWGNASKESGVSPEFCLENFFPFAPVPCLVSVAMEALGIAIILGAFLNKAPVILNIVNNKSVAGMSPSALYGETIMYANSAFYSVLKGNPFSTYGENLVITVQSVVVCVLCWVYAVPKIGMTHRLCCIAAFGVYLFGVFVLISPTYYYMLMSVNFPVLFFSRGTQIYTYYTCKHTGTSSLITTGMNLVGSAIRIVTTIAKLGFDIPMLSGYGISFTLNSIMVAQFLLYKKNTNEYLASLKKKNE